MQVSPRRAGTSARLGVIHLLGSLLTPGQQGQAKMVEQDTLIKKNKQFEDINPV